MSLSRAAAEILREQVTLEVEGIDRMYLNVYVPALQPGRRCSQLFPILSRPPARFQRLDGSHHQGVRCRHGASSLPGSRRCPS
jgi:hypothetical protein